MSNSKDQVPRPISVQQRTTPPNERHLEKSDDYTTGPTVSQITPWSHRDLCTTVNWHFGVTFLKKDSFFWGFVTIKMGVWEWYPKISVFERGVQMSHYNYDEERIQWRTKINTQHVSLRKLVEEKVRGKESEDVLSSTRQVCLLWNDKVRAKIKTDMKVVYNESMNRELKMRPI